MKYSIFLFVFIFIASAAVAQRTDSTVTSNNARISIGANDAIYIINTEIRGQHFSSDVDKLDSDFDPAWVKSICVMHAAEAVRAFGIGAQHGAIVIDLEKTAFANMSAEWKKKLRLEL